VATLYSFRRCPYAIRARLALAVGERNLDLVEVDLKAKPERMLQLSPKGTVPVVELDDGTVLEESLDVMRWSLSDRDPNGWLGESPSELNEMLALIEENDGDFKHHLDRTKYAVRFEGADSEVHRKLARVFLDTLAERLVESAYLFGGRPKLADWAILPFVRQFANIDRERFDAEVTGALSAWLDRGLASPLFQLVMQKGGPWARRRPTVT
jgi:glutathione S-transferase